MNKRTTVFTCCNKEYEDFIPLFVSSLLFSNKNVDIEVGMESTMPIELLMVLKGLSKVTTGDRKIIFRKVDFQPITLEDKTYRISPNVVRFLTTPKVENPYVYIGDIDIITLEDIPEFHINQMEKFGMDYSNVVRPNSNPPRLTGLHFTKWDSYYPIPNREDLIKRGLLGGDEAFLYELVKKKSVINADVELVRPVHGIHCSPNREPLAQVGWELFPKWKEKWKEFRISKEYNAVAPIFSERIKGVVETIDTVYFEI